MHQPYSESPFRSLTEYPSSCPAFINISVKGVTMTSDTPMGPLLPW